MCETGRNTEVDPLFLALLLMVRLSRLTPAL